MTLKALLIQVKNDHVCTYVKIQIDRLSYQANKKWLAICYANVLSN